MLDQLQKQLGRIQQKHGISDPMPTDCDQCVSIREAIARVEYLEYAAGTPAPNPAKAPMDGSTQQQLQCLKIAHLIYRIELLEGVAPATAWSNYCAAYDACYAE